MRFKRLLVSCGLALLLSGCVSGQTGSPDCVGPVSCLCDPLYAPGPLLRVHGESADGSGHLVAVVDQVFSLHPTDIQVGDRVGGSIMREKSCDPGYHESTLVGADLFIMFFRGNDGGYPNCSAFQACASQNCEGLPEPKLSDCWSTCSTQTEATCEAARRASLLDGAFSWVIPWGDTLDFGDPVHRFSSADLSALENVNTCLARFPADPAPPCHDTNDQVTCTIRTAVPEAHGPYGWPGLLAFLGVVAALRRRRKRTSVGGGTARY